MLLIWYRQTNNIPGPGALKLTHPQAFQTINYAAVACMAQESNVHNARLFIVNKTITSMEIDWTNGNYVDSVSAICFGY